jgi:hypothetical protein
MFFLLDTCALNHIQELHIHKIIDLRENLSRFRIGITNAVLTEWIHYGLVDFFPPTNCYILPVQIQEIEQLLFRFPFFSDFDEADQTLLWVLIHEPSVLISDDGGLNAAALSMEKKAIFLPDWCLSLVKEGFLTKNDVRKTLKYWEKTHRFRMSDLKRWNEFLNHIS